MSIGTGFITIHHLSRNSFFFLTGLVVCYSQIVHPRSLSGFWRRRSVQLGVPYLVWTAIYLLFSWLTIKNSWDEVGTFLRHNLFKGYSQLYAVIVTFQFYLVLPLFLRLLRATPRHVWIMTVSMVFALGLGLDLHYPTWFPFLSYLTNSVNSVWPWARDLLTYQEFFVAGTLVAFHFDQIVAFVAAYYRRIWLVTGISGGLIVLWYWIQVGMGNSVERASQVSQPLAVIWCFAAIAGIFAFSWWWNQKSGLRHRVSVRQAFPSVGYVAALTGGVYFSHTLFITTIRSILAGSGLQRTSLVGGHRRHLVLRNGDYCGRLRFPVAPHKAEMGAGWSGPSGTGRRLQHMASPRAPLCHHLRACSGWAGSRGRVSVSGLCRRVRPDR